MRLPIPGTPHLTYCTNIHPGESWPEVRANLERFTVAVKREVSPDGPFGLGLRLSERAATTLAQPGELARLQAFFRDSGLYLFTLNGFPYGPFHGEPVKEKVYLPDWTDEARLRYTDRLADLLVALLPDDPEVEGSISTVPGAFRPRVQRREEVDAMAAMIARHAAHLYRIRERTGRRIRLALEPEPFCYLETTDEAIRFIRDHLRSTAAVRTFAKDTGLGREEAEQFLREHVGVCLDTCHMAVAYEDAGDAVQALRDAGIRPVKAQITAGLEVEFDGTGADADADADKLRALGSFADTVYLHQVVDRRAGTLHRHLDLPQALAQWRETGLPQHCRIHFHVPVFREGLGPFRGTQQYVADFLALLRSEAVVPHLEVETYTWDVLPAEFRRESIVDAIAGELRWVVGQLDGSATTRAAAPAR
jgi:sugar phosphate isomerase/epimerase